MISSSTSRRSSALLLISLLQHVQAASRLEYINNAINATDVLNQMWYDSSNGLWQNLWWNSANMITAIADLAQVDSSFLSTANYYFQTTFVAAQAANGGSFINNYYDDEGWWAMGWIKVFDITGNATYLNAAESIFADIEKGDDATCGGHWWSKDDDANTAIGNELYLAVAASLANRVSDQKDYYQNIATAELEWFLNSGMMNSNNTFNDGLNITTCEQIGPVWTYNQGVILGALAELYKATSNDSYLSTASAIAHGAIDQLSINGILTEHGGVGPLDFTSSQFKGVFVRNLGYLQAVAADDTYVTFLQANADSIWNQDREDGGQIGPAWQGPYFDATAASQSAALDCLVAAAAVSS